MIEKTQRERERDREREREKEREREIKKIHVSFSSGFSSEEIVFRSMVLHLCIK